MRPLAPWAVEPGAAPQVVAETGRRGPQAGGDGEPRPGNPAASLCTQPQTAWTPPQGWGEASPTLLDSELCITQRRAATLAAGAGTRARDFAATAHLFYCAEQDRSLAYF